MNRQMEVKKKEALSERVIKYEPNKEMKRGR